MKYTKALAFVAVAIMLAVPIGALFADADVSADAEKKNKTVDGEKAVYAKAGKELNREQFGELVPGAYQLMIISSAIAESGLNYEMFMLSEPKVNTFKITSLEIGKGCKIADNTYTDIETMLKVKGEYDFTYTFLVDHSYKEFITGMSAKTGDAVEAFKAYFGETVKAGTEVNLSAKFDLEISISEVKKFVNISTGELVLSLHKSVINTLTKIDDGKLKIGDKTATFNTDIKAFITEGFDYSIGSGAKLDDKVEKASTIWDLSGGCSQKFKFGDKEVAYTPDSKDYFESQEKEKERLESAAKATKEKKISEATDILTEVAGVYSIVQNADVNVIPVSWASADLDEQKLKENGFTTSTDKMDDVQNAANSIAPSNGKSPVLFIVIAVVAVVVVAGVVFVVMKKKSA